MRGVKTYDAAIRETERLRGELVEESPGRASREELSRWADDPVAWDLEAGRNPTDYQRAVMESVATTKRTAWKACHAAGKDFCIGSLAVWAAYSRGSLVLVVSATERQVINQTMKEVRKAWRAARKAHGIGGELYQGSVRVGGEDRIVALTGSANVDALTGWHDNERGVVVLISEGQGERLEDAAYDAAESNVTTEQGRILAAGNPVRPSGRFYRIHQRGSWARFQTSAFDTPNVKAGTVVRPGFPAPDWPEDVAGEYGEDSAFYRGRVLAEFPETATDALVKREWLDAAVERHASGELEGVARNHRIVVGVDPARLGPDRTVLCVRRGPVVEEFRSWQGLDTMETAGRVYREVERLLEASDVHTTDGVKTVYVDEVGLGGGVLDRLKETLPELTYSYGTTGRRGYLRRRKVRTVSPKAEGFAAGTGAELPDRFRNLKAQGYWRLRRELEDGRLALPDDPDLLEELMKTRVKFGSDDRTEIESKEQLKGRLGRSPDKADALMLTMRPLMEDHKPKFRIGR